MAIKTYRNRNTHAVTASYTEAMGWYRSGDTVEVWGISDGIRGLSERCIFVMYGLKDMGF